MWSSFHAAEAKYGENTIFPDGGVSAAGRGLRGCSDVTGAA
jgi:hypothetical protein